MRARVGHEDQRVRRVSARTGAQDKRGEGRFGERCSGEGRADGRTETALWICPSRGCTEAACARAVGENRGRLREWRRV